MNEVCREMFIIINQNEQKLNGIAMNVLKIKYVIEYQLETDQNANLARLLNLTAPAINHKLKKFCIYRGVSGVVFLKNPHNWTK